MNYPHQIEDLITHFGRLPGVGPRTATRFVFHLLNAQDSEVLSFSKHLVHLLNVTKCGHCGAYKDDSELSCKICDDETRKSKGILCIVENYSDLLAIERSQRFDGRYHILGGVLNPLLGIGPDQLDLNKLVRRVKDEKIERVILALNPSVEGDATCSYLKEIFLDLCVVERIGFGIPIGGSLEFVDSQTISTALDNRRLF